MNISTSLPLLGFAEPKEARPKIAILDDFDLNPAGFPHGQAVESVLLSHSDLADGDIQRVQNTPKEADFAKMMREEKLDFRTAYGALVARNVAHFYLGTATNLERVLREQPEVQVISQSQGETPGRQLEMAFNKLKDDPNFRSGVARSFGLKPNASLAQVCQTMLLTAVNTAEESEICKKARDHYTKVSKEVHDRGITYLVASGNHGNIGHALEQIGVGPIPSAFRNILVNDYVTVVGSLAPDGTPSPNNSPGAAIEVLRRGDELEWSAEEFDMEGVTSGSSFATPVAAAEALEILEENPDADPFSVESQLMGLDSYQVSAGETSATSNGQSLVGDGVLESYISAEIGEGFITDIQSPDAQQIAQASRDSILFPLPGKEDHQFQLVKMRPDTDGNRRLTIETYFTEGHHLLSAVAKDGAWDPKTVVEELHLDAERQRKIEENKPD